jgi:ATP-binding cassette subfamily B (MDR/TAP) protein 1
VLQRVFIFGGNPHLYALEGIAVVAAIASGVASALVNLIMGRFLSLLSDFSFKGESRPEKFMSAVQDSA